MFPIVPILVFTTIINSIVPSGPILEPLASPRPLITSLINATRVTPPTWGRTFVDYADGFFSAGISLVLPPLWAPKTPARRSVCISRGMRLTATPAQCMTLVTSQLGIPPPTGLSLSAPRAFLTLPASPHPVFLTLPPASVRSSFLMLPAPKRVLVLELPAPKPLLTLSGPLQLPTPAVFLPALDDLYTFPFPTFVAYVVPQTWEAPADLLWSVRGARNIFAAQHVVDARKAVTFLVVECLVGLALIHLLLTCTKDGVLDLTDSISWLVRCTVNFDLEYDILEAYFIPEYAEDETDGFDADAFASLDSMVHEELGISPEKTVDTNGQDPQKESLTPEDAHPPTTIDVVSESTDLEIPETVAESEKPATEEAPAPEDTCVEPELAEEVPHVDTATTPSDELAKDAPAELPVLTETETTTEQDGADEQLEEVTVHSDEDMSSGPATEPYELDVKASTSDTLEESDESFEPSSETPEAQPEETRVDSGEDVQTPEYEMDAPTSQPKESANEESNLEAKVASGSSREDEPVAPKDNESYIDVAPKAEEVPSKVEATPPVLEPVPVESPTLSPRVENAATGLSANRWAPVSGSQANNSCSGPNGGVSLESSGSGSGNDGRKKGGRRQRGKKWQGNEAGGGVDAERSGGNHGVVGEGSGDVGREGVNGGGDGDGPRGNSRPQWFIKTRRKARR